MKDGEIDGTKTWYYKSGEVDSEVTPWRYGEKMDVEQMVQYEKRTDSSV